MSTIIWHKATQDEIDQLACDWLIGIPFCTNTVAHVSDFHARCVLHAPIAESLVSVSDCLYGSEDDA